MSKVKKSTPIATKSTKIGKGNIQNLIKEEAEVIKRKKEIYEQIKAFNKELGELNKKGLGKLGLNERVMMVGAQGFGTGAQANPTGFVYPQNISRVAELEAEMAPDEPVVLDKPEGSVIEDPTGKPMVDDEVKKQLIDMKEKLEMILSSISGGAPIAPTEGGVETITTTPGGEAAQAAAQTETPEAEEIDGEEKEEAGDEEEGKEEEEDGEEASDEEEEEIVIKENKKYTATLKHDKGTKKITTNARSEEAAIKLFMSAEGCPRSAISNVTEK